MNIKDEVLKLGEELISDPIKNANHAAKLLRRIDSSEDEAKASIRALGIFFQQHLKDGSLKLGNGNNGAKEQKKYEQWLKRQYQAFILKLMTCFSSEVSQSVKVSALSVIMELTRSHPQKSFHAAPFLQALEVILPSQNSSNLVTLIASAYLHYVDIRYYTWKAIHNLARASALNDKESRMPGQNNIGEDSVLAENIYILLCNSPALSHAKKRKIIQNGEDAQEEEEENLQSWCGHLEKGSIIGSTKSEGSQRRKKRRLDQSFSEDQNGFGEKNTSAKWVSQNFQKRAFSDAWMSFIGMGLPQDLFRKVLIKLHEDVIPNLSNPLQVADLLSGALESGGILGMLALHAIFTLVTKYGLEYPQFYAKLYELLDSSIFYAKFRSRFFQLADVFLSSSLIPAYTIASFIKRFSRLALLAPPAGAMICIGFIHNLLRRHPACLVLLDCKKENPEVDEEEGNDPFLENEKDPAKTQALDSSLWELKSLSNHYYNQVSLLATQTLEKDLSDKKKTAELDISELIGGSYSNLVSNELSRRIKQVPVAFYQTAPKGLFDSLNESGFSEWTF